MDPHADSKDLIDIESKREVSRGRPFATQGISIMKLTGIAVLFSAGLLAACAQGESGGFTKMRADATPYADAHAECWGEAGSLLGGNAMDMARQRAFDNCMALNGWQDQHVLFGGGQAAPQSAGKTPGKQPSLDTCRAEAIANNISGESLHSFMESCMNRAGGL
jgi:hypothetical protein